MLIEFTVENFRSIKNPISLSMVASADKILENNLIKNALNDDSLLKSAAIYGANASGKTNLLMAIEFLRALVLNSHSHQKGTGIRFNPFKLDKDWNSRPTKMSVHFIRNSTRYFYEVSYNNESIISENLYHYQNNKKAIVFERSTTANFKFTTDVKDQDIIAQRTLPNVLYLSKATQDNFKNDKISDTFDWFRNGMDVILSTDTEPNQTSFKLASDSNYKNLVLKALLEADVGIEDIRTESNKVSFEEFQKMFKNFPAEVQQLIFRDKGETEIHKITTLHKKVPFDFGNEESGGTQRIFSLIGPMIEALKGGKVLLVDEMDVRLHPLLTIFLVKLFLDPTQNKSNAQLIFTTHNTHFLNQDILRRDQIWFTEKEPSTGRTDLYSLVEYSPRKDADIEKGYLAGKYGALPFIKDGRIF